jgi:hypothetical protein
MTASSVPYDVLDNVTVYLDRQSLVSVCLVNKLFNIAASRALYSGELTIDPRTPKVSALGQPPPQPLTLRATKVADPPRIRVHCSYGHMGRCEILSCVGYTAYICSESRYTWHSSTRRASLLHEPFPSFPGLRAFRFSGEVLQNPGSL